MRKILSTSANHIRLFRTYPLIKLIAIIALLIPLYYLLYKIYIPRINAFGCFDDCFNFAGGYFLSRGKTLFSEIYFNHQPLMAYLSYFVQKIYHPVNIYALLLAHRQTLLLFSFLFQALLIWRFGFIGLTTMLIYEFTKFYVFGDRFLAESFIVYPLTYLLGLMIISIQHRRTHIMEYVIASGFTWFIVFMREPYVPLGLFIFFILFYKKLFSRISLLSFLFFIILTIFLFSLFPFNMYVNNVIVLNLTHGSISEMSLTIICTEFLKSLFYPLYIFIFGSWNDFRIILIALGLLYIGSFFVITKRKKITFLFIILTVTLFFANLRPTFPGLQYYEAFHMMIWYGLFIFSSIFIFHEACSTLHKKYLFYAGSALLMLYIIFSPRSYVFQKTDSHTEFITNYGHYIGIGEVIKALSIPDQTMFTDGNEELLYWQADRPSAYAYSFYYPAEKNSIYYEARLKMFAQTPPDFYYDFCTPLAPVKPSIPTNFIHLYRQLYEYGNPSCLHIKASLVPSIKPDQWEKAKEFGYSLGETQ